MVNNLKTLNREVTQLAFCGENVERLLRPAPLQKHIWLNLNPPLKTNRRFRETDFPLRSAVDCIDYLRVKCLIKTLQIRVTKINIQTLIFIQI